jgi:peptidoglycan/LPS O-acetylase OafA/YrhL
MHGQLLQDNKKVSTGRSPLERLSPRESIYLDLLRSLAALAVILSHAASIFTMPHAPTWGHEAVIIFFVLSGYVISHVADTRETDARTFIVARLARLWSVLVPAMALTAVCDFVGRHYGIDRSIYAASPANMPMVRLAAPLVFLSETWVSIQPLSNGVVWSLCAELWYYMLFATWNFVQPGRRRLTLLAAAALLAGHKALLLMPIWLMGVALQRSRALRRFATPRRSAVLFAGAFVLIACILLRGGYVPPTHAMQRLASPWLYKQLAQARVFWFDWLVGALVTAHLLGARTIASRLPLERIGAPVRWCAGVSFAAYLFHVPLLDLCAAFLPKSQGLLALALTLAVIGTLGRLVERSKRWWRRRIDATADVILGSKQGLFFEKKNPETLTVRRSLHPERPQPK